MRKKNYKGRCEKRSLAKCRGICKSYDTIQSRYADMLQSNEKVKEFQCISAALGIGFQHGQNLFVVICNPYSYDYYLPVISLMLLPDITILFHFYVQNSPEKQIFNVRNCYSR